MEQLKAIAETVEYIERHGAAFVEQVRQGNFNAIAATDLKAQADRLSRNIGAVALSLRMEQN